MKGNLTERTKMTCLALGLLIAPAQADIALVGQSESEIEKLTVDIEGVEIGDGVLDETALQALGQKRTKLTTLQRRLEVVKARLATGEDRFVLDRIKALSKVEGDENTAIALPLLRQWVEDAGKNDVDVWQQIGNCVQALYVEALAEFRAPHFKRTIAALTPLFLTPRKAAEWARQTDLLIAYHPSERFQSGFNLRSAERAMETFERFLAGKDPVDFETQRSAASADEKARIAAAKQREAAPTETTNETDDVEETEAVENVS